MPGDNILDHPDLRGLDELERQQAAEELKTPEGKINLLLRTSLALRLEAKNHREHCQQVCAPAFDGRLTTLEKAAARLKYKLAGMGILVGLALPLVIWLVEKVWP